MRIEIVVARRRGRAMHVFLARRLRAAGHATRFVEVDGLPSWATGVALLMLFEDTIYAPLKVDLLSSALLDEAGFDGDADLVIDLSNGAVARHVAVMVPLYDGSIDEEAGMSAVLDGRAPSIIVAHRDSLGAFHEYARGLPALEHRHRFKDSFNRVIARVNDLLLQAVDRISRGDTTSTALAIATPKATGLFAPIGFGAASLVGRLKERLKTQATSGEAWGVAWRRVNGDAIRQTFAWPNADYAFLKDDGARYYADPFIFAHGDRTWVFVEEFPYATNKGIISVFEISRDGVVAAPKPVLEAPYHLSYPLVFRHNGVIYMMPESCGARRLELYRAERFPDVWVREGVLLDNVVASDATILERDGAFRLFATISEEGQSDWDYLHVYSGDTPLGPWRPHPRNPVLIDASQARAAGHAFTKEGRLFRPTQDCSRGYGSALAICEIENLDDLTYSQRVVARLDVGRRQGFHGVHTLNDGAGIEVIDLLGARGLTDATHVGFVNHADP
jgi:hypothetical protein